MAKCIPVLSNISGKFIYISCIFYFDFGHMIKTCYPSHVKQQIFFCSFILNSIFIAKHL